MTMYEEMEVQFQTFFISALNGLAQWYTLDSYSGRLGSKFGRDTGYPERFMSFFFSPSRQIPGQYLN
jgi:hypothetical protein